MTEPLGEVRVAVSLARLATSPSTAPEKTETVAAAAREKAKPAAAAARVPAKVAAELSWPLICEAAVTIEPAAAAVLMLDVCYLATTNDQLLDAPSQ